VRSDEERVKSVEVQQPHSVLQRAPFQAWLSLFWSPSCDLAAPLSAIAIAGAARVAPGARRAGERGTDRSHRASPKRATQGTQREEGRTN
jgi:hypothetical protein